LRSPLTRRRGEVKNMSEETAVKIALEQSRQEKVRDEDEGEDEE
jgi:hypothetical protein